MKEQLVLSLEQEAPHVHYADLTPDNRLVVCDLGMDLCCGLRRL